jgi:pimeloyl-ACP methyl ester carboxylesterase
VDLVRLALSELTDSAVQVGTVDSDARTLTWVEAGSGARIVMVAGAGETVLTWAPLFKGLVDRGRIIAYDRAGLGSSDPHQRSTAQSATDDLAAVLDAVGPSIVVGHSWGGLLAEALALTRPDLLRGLVLLDPTHEGVFDAVPLRMRLAESVMLRGIVVRHWFGRAGPIVHGMATDLAEHCTSDDATRARITEAYEASYSKTSQLATIGRENRISGHCSSWMEPIRAQRTYPDIPIIVLMAGDKPFADRSRALNEAATPSAEHVFIQESGHYIHRDHPSAVLDALDRVVEKASSSG